MDEARAKTLCSDGGLHAASNVMGDDSHDGELTPYSDDVDVSDLEFADVPVDSYVGVPASIPRDFDAICEVCRSANVAVPEDVRGVFGLVVQNLKAIKERNSAVAGKADVLERVHIVEKTAVGSMTGWALEKIGTASECDEKRNLVKCLNTDLVVLREQIFGQATVQPEGRDVQNASSRFEVRRT